jgi:hypothetical protein
VGAGLYSSWISPEDANQQAMNDVLLNGQAWANNPANGSQCNVGISYNNQSNVNWTFTATNNSTGLVYNSTLNAYVNGTLSVSMPAGTYTFVIASGAQTMATPPQITVNGSVQTFSQTTNVTATFTNVNVSTSGTNPFISVALVTGGPCSFTPFSGWQIPTSGISASAGVVTFYIVLVPTSSVSNWYTHNTVATVNGGCVPTATRTFNKTDASGRNWEIKVYSSGQMSIKLLSGTPPNTGNSFYISNATYNL